jgi:hypothetical protein
MKVKLKERYGKILLKSFVGGIGWAVGVTLGFALLAYFLGFLFHRLGGIPLIGNWLAGLVEATNQALEVKKALPR